MRLNLFLLVFNLIGFEANSQSTRDSLLGAFENSNDYSEKSYILADLAMLYFESNSDSALYFANQGLILPGVENDLSGLSYFSTLSGVILKNAGQYDSAVVYLENAIEFQRLDTFELGMAGNYNNLGNVYKELGNYEASVQNFLLGLEIFERFDDSAHVGEVHSNLGKTYIRMEDFEKAEYHINESGKIYELQNKDVQIAFLNFDKGQLEVARGNFEEAQNKYRKAVNFWKVNNRWRKYISGRIAQGRAFIEMNRLDSALYMLELGREKAIEVDYELGLAETMFLKGKVQRLNGKPQICLGTLLEAEKITLRNNNNELLVNIWEEQYLAYKSTGNYKMALFRMEKWIELKNNILGVEQKRSIANLQFKYDILNKERTIEKLEDSTRIQLLTNNQLTLETETANSKAQTRLFITLGLAVFLIIIMVFLWRINKSNKSNKALNAKLNLALEERNVLMKEIHHRVKNNLQIVSSLLNLQEQVAKNGSPDIILKEARNRIEAMALMHEKLYKSENLKEINFDTYLTQLISHLTSSFGLKEKGIKTEINVTSANMNMDTLVPLGLIINELVTNSIKHAFSEKGGTIMIIGEQQGEKYSISVLDDGIGFPNEINLKNTRSLGLRLVSGLVRQMKGEFTLSKEIGLGTEFIISFPIENAA